MCLLFGREKPVSFSAVKIVGQRKKTPALRQRKALASIFHSGTVVFVQALLRIDLYFINETVLHGECMKERVPGAQQEHTTLPGTAEVHQSGPCHEVPFVIWPRWGSGTDQ